MVTKLENNKSYINYIKRQMNEIHTDWEEESFAHEGLINNNFQINFHHLNKKVSFIKDRGLLELNYYINDKLIYFDNFLYDSILEKIPEQDVKWRLSLCTELIDYYIDYLKQFFKEEEEEE